jgi:hypothetical protein
VSLTGCWVVGVFPIVDLMLFKVSGVGMRELLPFFFLKLENYIYILARHHFVLILENGGCLSWWGPKWQNLEMTHL